MTLAMSLAMGLAINQEKILAVSFAMNLTMSLTMSLAMSFAVYEIESSRSGVKFLKLIEIKNFQLTVFFLNLSKSIGKFLAE